MLRIIGARDLCLCNAWLTKRVRSSPAALAAGKERFSFFHQTTRQQHQQSWKAGEESYRKKRRLRIAALISASTGITVTGAYAFFAEATAQPQHSQIVLCESKSRKSFDAYNFDDFYSAGSSLQSYLTEDPKETKRVKKSGPRSAQMMVMSPYAIADAVEKATPGLVNITVWQLHSWGQKVTTTGSGFIFDAENRLVATNYHVIQHATEETMLITLSGGDRYLARVHSFDRATDIAILQLLPGDHERKPSSDSGKHETKNREDTFGFFGKSFSPEQSDSFGAVSSTTSQLPCMELGSSSDLRPGEWVMALGSPLNMQNTVTAGIVSFVNRQASELGITQRRTDYIQTDASINQGSSGGPLINLQGKVVGINTMKIANNGGIGFAIPIDTAKIVLNQLKTKRRVDRPYLGLKMSTFQKFGDSNNEFGVNKGVLVTDVAPSSPAHKARLNPGDIIIKVDNQAINNTYDLVKIIGCDIGKTHRVEVLARNGKRKTCSITSTAATL